MKKYFLLFFVVFTLIQCKTTIQVANIKDTRIPSNNSLIYALPKSIVEVKVYAKKQVFIPGPFANYAKELLGITNTGKTKTTKWQITNINIDSYSVPDSNRVFVINSSADKALNLQLTNNGIISGINSNYNNILDNQEIEYTYIPEYKDIDYQFINPSYKKNFFEKSDTTYKVVKKDSIFIKIPVVKTSSDIKSQEDIAIDLAIQITRLKKRKFKLQAGIFEKSYNGEGIEIMFKEIKELEEKYLEFFIGKTVESKEMIYTFKYEPIKAKSQTDILCYLSEDKGVSVDRKLNSVPLYIEYETSELNSVIKTYQDSLTKLENKESGLIYIIPETTEFNILKNNQIIASKSLLIPQFGSLNMLPAVLLKNRNSIIEFFPKFGSIKRIETL